MLRRSLPTSVTLRFYPAASHSIRPPHEPQCIHRCAARCSGAGRSVPSCDASVFFHRFTSLFWVTPRCKAPAVAPPGRAHAAPSVYSPVLPRIGHKLRVTRPHSGQTWISNRPRTVQVRAWWLPPGSWGADERAGCRPPRQHFSS